MITPRRRCLFTLPAAMLLLKECHGAFSCDMMAMLFMLLHFHAMFHAARCRVDIFFFFICLLYAVYYAIIDMPIFFDIITPFILLPLLIFTMPAMIMYLRQFR